MANQRPIRVPPHARRRWRRKRPRRWIDGNSNSGFPENCAVDRSLISCEPIAPKELFVGDLDADWSDRSEVLISGIRGTISFQFVDIALVPVIVRFAVLATEETDRVYSNIDLFDPESVEEYDWMWLEQFTFGWYDKIDPDSNGIAATSDRQIDIKTKRKLGKKDSVVLYAQWKSLANEPGSTTAQVWYVNMLRLNVVS